MLTPWRPSVFICRILLLLEEHKFASTALFLLAFRAVTAVEEVDSIASRIATLPGIGASVTCSVVHVEGGVDVEEKGN